MPSDRRASEVLAKFQTLINLITENGQEFELALDQIPVPEHVATTSY